MNQGKLEVVKQEMARVNLDILGISKVKWTGIGEFNSDDHYIYYCRQESLRKSGVAIMVNKSLKSSTWMQSQKRQNDLFVSKANHSISQLSKSMPQPDVPAGFRKGRGTRDQIANIRCIIEKAREFQKNIYFWFTDYAEAWLCGSQKTGKFFKRCEYHTTSPASGQTCMQVKKQQFEPDMEQWTGSKLGKGYIKVVYCHSAYLTSMQSTYEECRAG